MNDNPYIDYTGLPKPGKENEAFDWEKRKANEYFLSLPIPQQLEVEKISERFSKKTNS